jgi:hypothetical protein
MASRKLALFVSMLALAIAALVPATASAWAPESSATIHPGVQTYTKGAQCTSNFIFQDASGVYIGQAAHCAATGAATETNGCEADSLPLGTPVEIDGASRPGTLVYSSWLTMQANGESDFETCEYNDFALVRIDPTDVGKVNPSVPGYGGPTGIGEPGAPGAPGADVYSYGNSSLRFGVTQTSPKQGKLVETSPDGWSHTVYTATPGIPGDSGSGFLSSTGAAFGTLSTVAVAPFPLSNGVSDLSRELGYARANSLFSGVALVPGTEPFSNDTIGAALGL